jgi:hypothetical protein
MYVASVMSYRERFRLGEVTMLRIHVCSRNIVK